MATETFRMNATYMYGMLLGGIVVSVLGGVAEYMKENKREFPSYKGIVRDFLVGAVLVLFLLQIVPESMESLVASLPALPGIPDLGGITGGSVEPDLQVGPARF